MAELELYAHTPPPESESWQLLGDHLKNVACQAAEFAEAFDAAELGGCLGLLHDLGKASGKFQHYLRECHSASRRGERPPATRVDHKTAGAVRARDGGGYFSLLGIPLLGHHGGMPDSSNAGDCTDPSRVAEARQALKNAAHLLAGELLKTDFPAQFTRDNLSCEMFLRMLYSCLVDADFLDTESHWNPDKTQARGQMTSIGNLWVRFQNDQANLQRQAHATPVNKMRREIYDACIQAADSPQGVFKLTVPTGGGKTRSGMAFALKHAIKHGLKRVIVAIPYTSIIDQNAQEYRKIFWNGSVLEHHSAVTPPETRDYSEEQLRMELAAENWDAPIVVTTTVQLFESLFSNKPSKCRKLHNLAGSVIILDEVQTLPLGMLQPILHILRELVTNYHVTLVLSTATQPAFSGDSPYLEGFDQCVEIVPDPKRYFDALKRVDYRVEHDSWTWDSVADEMRKREQVLCVLNSRKDAVALFKLLDDPDALHLSTLMCPAHRRDVLDEIRDRLRQGLPCRVVSTQVVEAGVDLDFPCVMRARGPLDRIVQAAGRCNREGRMDGPGEVIVFEPEEGRAPKGAYRTAMAEADRLLEEDDCDLHDPDVFDRYFKALWQDCNLDAEGVVALQKSLEYLEVACRFKIIGDEAVPVLVSYQKDKLDTLVAEITKGKRLTRREWRRVQVHSVNLRRKEFEELRGHIAEVLTGTGLYRWYGGYDRACGIQGADVDAADLMV